ncbi:TetR/AcrR family transcriptional regulator [Nonomuraea angiospora]|uniref:TetR/AcrR family transcriptional regulator n=1 Tax=Nonomuraea angiospora TaxID=46172 RepID=UPI0029A19806|nr:helix-turn-helix domain-containing protein [Nonomuraea angiospora]MDX3108666.1 helix-turn-helix domain containing protein [Nonomuraea angiospora]
MPARKPYAVGIARRQQILQAARELFSVRGYRGASMRDVASQVGLTLAGVLHYFPTKEDLLAEVLQHRDDIDIPWFEDKWAELGSFRAAMRELMVRNMAARGVMRLFVTLSAEATDPDHPAHDFFVKRYRTSRELFSSTLAKAKARGEVSELADGPVLIAVLDGLQVQWLIEPGFDLLAALEAYLDTITTER